MTACGFTRFAVLAVFQGLRLAVSFGLAVLVVVHGLQVCGILGIRFLTIWFEVKYSIVKTS